MKDKLYVQVKKARFSTYWYAECIGDIFSVKEDDERPSSYILINENGWIDKDDCTIVNVDVLPKTLTEN